eukprot:TRINITY_DN6977_c0_g1_i6.p1 TRINITY_DN6977_c0_g1~~TRINITY_DN6977_c0_g1_i6.p1  ORF type:complete len:291 (+),score=82.18 TRINITY_DN6977_c0_g1_i6:85-957(+)
MFGSPAFTQGATLPMDTQGTQPEGKQAKKEDRLSVLPVTVRMLEDEAGKKSGSDANIELHGSEPGMLILVGCVETMTKQAASVEFVLNDATGRMRCRYFTIEGHAALACVEVGKYITVAGSLRTSPAVHVSATTLRAVRSPDEISYHMIEAAHAMLRLTRPQPAATMAKDIGFAQMPMQPAVAAKPLSQQPPSADVVMTPAQEAVPAAPVAATPAAAPQAAADGPAFRQQVLQTVQTLNEELASEEGVHKSKVYARLSSVPQAKVQAMLQQLLDGGEIFPTIDDDHVAPI